MSLLSKVPPIGQVRQREMMKSARSLTYLETPEGPVQCHFFLPEDYVPDKKYPVVLLYHGGFWDTPMPTQFVPLCLHFASRGAIAIAAETRTASIHGASAEDALADATRISEWLAEYAERFGIDPDNVVLGGASGGAYLALQQVLPKSEPSENSLKPKALMLFSSLLNPTMPPVLERFADKKAAKQARPLKQVRRKLPPMILFHGKNDRVTPFEDAVKFTRAMKWRRNPIQLVDFEKAEHSFFNFNVSELFYELTQRASDHFLVDLGILEPDPLENI